VTGSLAGWTWTPATGLEDPMALQPIARPVGNTAYTVAVVTTDGCKAKATEKVEVFYDLKLPAAFSPNGDGRNDVFRAPPQTPVTIQRFAVYNRKGAMVFYTTNADEGWNGMFNGQPQPAGVYVWYIEYNNPITKTVGEKQGTVVLVR
jgi:gliding motility-associated-like protein